MLAALQPTIAGLYTQQNSVIGALLKINMGTSLRDRLEFMGSSATQLLRDQHLQSVDNSEALIANALDSRSFIEHVGFILAVHIPLEDDILIPAFMPYLKECMGDLAPMTVITDEHQGLRTRYEGALHLLGNRKAETDAMEELSKRCGKMAEGILGHIYKEEKDLFGLVEQYLPESVKKDVSSKISSRSAMLDKEFVQDKK